MREWAAVDPSTGKAQMPDGQKVRRRMRFDAFTALLKSIYGENFEAADQKQLARCGNVEAAKVDVYQYLDCVLGSYRLNKDIDYGAGITYCDPFVSAIPMQYEQQAS